MSELHIREARVQDVEALSAFMRAQGQARCAPAYLAHWYFGNPSGSASVIVGEQEGRIVGMATTNDHTFTRDAERALVAMPQKVLTDAAVRGQGIFGRLYRASEEAAWSRGAGFFLTVTNAASTPIFLERFGYLRLPSPRLALLPAWPGALQAGPIDAADAPARSSVPDVWCMDADAGHRRWRYAPAVADDLLCLRLPDRGWVFVRKARKAGLPVLLVLDLVPERPAMRPQLLAALRRLAWREGTVGALLLVQAAWKDALNPAHPRLLRSSGFNLLVKGRDAAHTHALARQRFDLAFGDLDFL
ncbi:MAG: GNAT family N-acetyltransferase [Flavobacteriales bacterium]|nr:GNAT family N-acetyltransferase [Flavobacteriales bacterium]